MEAAQPREVKVEVGPIRRSLTAGPAAEPRGAVDGHAGRSARLSQQGKLYEFFNT